MRSLDALLVVASRRALLGMVPCRAEGVLDIDYERIFIPVGRLLGRGDHNCGLWEVNELSHLFCSILSLDSGWEKCRILRSAGHSNII